MSTLTRALKATTATALALPAVTASAARSAWKAAWASGDPSPFSLVEGMVTLGRAWSGGLSMVWGSAFGWSYARLAKLAFTNPVASRAIRLVAQAAAEAPVYVEKRNGSGWDAAESGFDDVLDLLDRPNARTTREAAMLAVVTALYCGGEFWVDKYGPMTGENRGKAKELRFIMPDEFKSFVRDRETGDVVGYRFQSRARSGFSSRSYERTVEECLHVRLFHPLDDERGLAVLVGAADQVAHMGKATAWNASIAEGGGRVKGYWRPVGLENGQQLTSDQQQAAQDSLNRKSAELAHRNLEMVLSGSLERVPGDVTPKDADWLKGLAWDVRMIAALTGVPATLIGDEKQGSLTDSGVDSEVRALYLLTVLPLLGLVLAELSAFLLGDGYRLAVDKDQIPALSEDMDAKAERIVSLYEAGILGLGEARTGIGYEDGAPDDLRPAPPASAPPRAEPDDDPDDEPEADPPEGRTAKGLGSLSVDAFGQLLDLVPKAA